MSGDDTTWIEALALISTSTGRYARGDVIPLPAGEAADLIRDGSARPADPPRPSTDTSTP